MRPDPTTAGPDMAYPEADADLERRDWTEVPPDRMGTVTPAVPLAVSARQPMTLRAFERKGDSTRLLLWFTAPDLLGYAQIEHGRRLLGAREVRALINSHPRMDLLAGLPAHPWVLCETFDGPLERVGELLGRGGWDCVEDVDTGAGSREQTWLHTSPEATRFVQVHKLSYGGVQVRDWAGGYTGLDELERTVTALAEAFPTRA